MKLDLKYLKKKYIKNFQNDEALCEFIMTDVIFGFSEIYDVVKKKESIKSILEIGSGTGILLNELKTFLPHISFKGIDPNESGFHKYKKIYESLDQGPEVKNIQVENYISDEKFDLVFSINVFEHVKDWRKYIEQTSKLLKKNGSNIILGPNYDFPYEPHFVIPIIINKEITKFFFKNKIKKDEIKTDEKGLWDGLNLAGLKQIKKHLKIKNYSFTSDYLIKDRILDRISNDKEFKRRQGIAAYITILAKFIFLDKLIFNFFKIPFPYMKLIISKKN